MQFYMTAKDSFDVDVIPFGSLLLITLKALMITLLFSGEERHIEADGGGCGSGDSFSY